MALMFDVRLKQLEVMQDFRLYKCLALMHVKKSFYASIQNLGYKHAQ